MKTETDISSLRGERMKVSDQKYNEVLSFAKFLVHDFNLPVEEQADIAQDLTQNVFVDVLEGKLTNMEMGLLRWSIRMKLFDMYKKKRIRMNYLLDPSTSNDGITWNYGEANYDIKAYNALPPKKNYNKIMRTKPKDFKFEVRVSIYKYKKRYKDREYDYYKTQKRSSKRSSEGT